MYDTPVWGIYTIRRPDFRGSFYVEKTKVKVLGESEKSMLIQLVCHIRNHRDGDLMKVRKHNVHIPQLARASSGIGPHDRPIKEYDYSTAYWNK